MKLQEKFSLTRHAQTRLRERFPHEMEDLNFEQSPALRIRKMYEFLWNSTVENRVVNDTMFMQYVQEKYGYDNTFKFFANHDMLFIGVIDPRGRNVIVTVVNRRDYSSLHLRPSERKLQKKPNTFRAKRPWFHIIKKKHEHLETHFDE